MLTQLCYWSPMTLERSRPYQTCGLNGFTSFYCSVITVFKAIRKGKPFTLEEYIPGEWRKTSMNDGQCHENSELERKLACLTHWALTYTDYEATILDVQGKFVSWFSDKVTSCKYIPYHPVLYRTIPYHTIPHHAIPYHTIPHHTIPYIPYHTITYLPCTRNAWL